MINYEAWDIENDVCIYSGGHKSSLITEVSDYILYQNHIDEDLINQENIDNLDNVALAKVGIKIYQNG